MPMRSSSSPSALDIHVVTFIQTDVGLITCRACYSGMMARLTTHVRVMHLRRCLGAQHERRCV